MRLCYQEFTSVRFNNVSSASLPNVLAACGLAPVTRRRSTWVELSAFLLMVSTPNAFNLSQTLPRHRPRQIADHRRLSVHRISEHSDFVSVIQKTCITFRSQQRSRTVTQREGMKAPVVRPMQHFAKVGIVPHTVSSAITRFCGCSESPD